MGTKNNPGAYDCYAAADPDEPIFVLRANDPAAPFLVRTWVMLWELLDIHINPDKIAEAKKCAKDMDDWRSKILGD